MDGFCTFVEGIVVIQEMPLEVCRRSNRIQYIVRPIYGWGTLNMTVGYGVLSYPGYSGYFRTSRFVRHMVPEAEEADEETSTTTFA